jgi:hypothetical protein
LVIGGAFLRRWNETISDDYNNEKRSNRLRWNTHFIDSAVSIQRAVLASLVSSTCGNHGGFISNE